MQDTEPGSPLVSHQQPAMSPYLLAKYDSPISSRSPSPSPLPEDKYASDDEISVGCPSPALNQSTPNCHCPETDDYFKPLKRLQMVNVETERRTSPSEEMEDRPDGVKSFSIVDILNHKPSKPQTTRIVRPWDTDPDLETQQRLESFHRQLKVHHLALLRPEFANFNASYTSETGSDRSSSVASDCCSPDIATPTVQRQRQHQQGGKQPGATPLDALFQMTSKTFDSSAGEASADGLNLSSQSSRQVKKKRKSRTAFTNQQIFGLEKRFLYQKYLSPADRDEIASTLGLTSAQVITWFQNRRAKMKRDMEEMKSDPDTVKLLSSQKLFLQKVHILNDKLFSEK